MSKLVLQDLASLTNETSALTTMNANNTATETALENTLSRDGTSPNQMGADLDMNSKRILNIGTPLDMNNSRIIDLPDAVALTEPVTLNQLNNAIFSGGGASAALPFITVSNTPSLSQERALAVTGSGLTLTDSGANGSITIGLDDDLNAVANLTTTGLVTRTAANTMTTRSLTQPAAGITISNNDGVAGNPTLALANDLGALEALSTTGIARRTGTDTWTASNAVTNAELNTTANQTIKSNISGGVATPSDNTLTSILDNIIGSSRGSIAVRGAANWQALPLGTNTQVLSSNGTDLVYAAGGSGSSLVTRRTITTTDTVVVGDLGNIIEITSGTFTLAFTAAATLANGFNTFIYNSGTGDVTLDPNGAELIDGVTSWVLYPGGAILVMCTGTAFESILLSPMQKIFTSGTTTWTTPGSSTFTEVFICGAGGGGGGGGREAAANFSSGGGGGGGGGCVYAKFKTADVGASQTVTVGTGGSGGSGATTNGSTGGSGNGGGNTTFGSLLTAFGGGGGSAGIAAGAGAGGGGGGGQTAAGGTSTASTTGGSSEFATSISTGGCGAENATVTPSTTPFTCGQGGGGGGSGSNTGNPGGKGSNSTSNGAPGGGGGGSINNANTGSVGGAGGKSMGCATSPSGGGTGASGGSTAATFNYLPGCGGGGGGGGQGTPAGGGTGGAGTSGSGGGGGGAGNAANGGAGGAGGNGFAVIISG